MFLLYCILIRNFDLFLKIWFDHFFSPENMQLLLVKTETSGMS